MLRMHAVSKASAVRLNPAPPSPCGDLLQGRTRVRSAQGTPREDSPAVLPKQPDDRQQVPCGQGFMSAGPPSAADSSMQGWVGSRSPAGTVLALSTACALVITSTCPAWAGGLPTPGRSASSMNAFRQVAPREVAVMLAVMQVGLA